MPNSQNDLLEIYTDRINRVFHFIEEAPDADLSLPEISKKAYFSPFHFHRIFKTITGETLNGYVTRRRVEKAASALLHKRNISITEISYQNGFNSSSSFTRAFKKFYGISPTEFRKRNQSTFRRTRGTESKNGQEFPVFEEYLCNIKYLINQIKMNAKIEIREIPKLNVAYVTSIGEGGIVEAFGKLASWAALKGILTAPGAKMLTIYHDSFKITEPEKVRLSAGIILREPADVSGEVGLTTIEKGKFIIGSFETGQSEFDKCWSSLFLWMNENGYKKANRNPFEIYHNDYRDHPEKKFIVDFHIPIE